MRSPAHSWLLLPAAALVLAYAGCGDSSAPSPFEGTGEGGENGFIDAGMDAPPDGATDPTLGPPCSDQGQCDDGIDCTVDVCDLELGRCRFQPDHAPCLDEIYCDGEERCEPGLGCREGEPVACDDLDTCTIDRCIEETQACEHSVRDADGDGDPLRNCEGGADCDDQDPLISSEVSERCLNHRDDDCDGETDEEDCVRPEHDTCLEALEIEADGNYLLSFAGAAHDYALSCEGSTTKQKAFRDLVVAIVVPEGDPVDVDITAQSSDEDTGVVLAHGTSCGKSSSETECRTSYKSVEDAQVARMRLRDLGPGAYAVYVASKSEDDVVLSVRFEEPVPAPENETCGTALPLEPEEHVTASLVSVDVDVTSACSSKTAGDLVYRFALEQPSDVRLRAVSLDGLGAPLLSLRGPLCATEELTCRRAAAAELFARALPAGEHYVAVSANGPTDLDVVLEVDPATEPLPGEGCANPLELDDETNDVDFADRPDAVQGGCLAGAPDASFGLELDEPSDVLVVARLSASDRASLLLARPPCALESQKLACVRSGYSPLRLASYAVAAGDYRIVTESAESKPIAFEYFVRPAATPTFVAFADECSGAVKIPSGGGRFEGNTSNQFGDYDASCDQGGGSPGGAPDQMLELALSSKRRVILDMRGSEFETLLSVRRGPDCPGTEVTLGCSVGTPEEPSFLDLTLDAGTYFVQIDGFDGDYGRWLLDAYVEPP